ncbi:MAG: hypothetical protein DHS20C15_31550 [Planctomycetota bacterium]|nr:MAG: hypothetical protein DHS20C15_31550 [Planctomycetota bacterium]
MDATPSLWEQIVRRASSLRRGYGASPTAPASTWSLVNRAAQRFGDGAGPDARDAGHYLAQWQLAMHCVLRDLHRRHDVARRHGLSGEQALGDDVVAAEASTELDADTREILGDALERLASTHERAAQVLALRSAAELPWREIAARLESTITTVRRDWALALAWLRRELKQRGITAPTEADS